jgi:biopolymer transport protein ExbD
MDVGGSRKGARSEINVTPLIDVVLVLLIIFMALTPAMLEHLTASIPRQADATTPPDPSANPIVLEYTAKGEITINGEAVSFESLADEISERLTLVRNKVVFFKIEDEANYGEVVELMDTVRGAGAKSLGIITKG